MEVILSSGKMLMPQVSGQERKFGVEILTVSIPASQGVDGEDVPKIVDPGPLAASRVSNTTLHQQFAKNGVHGAQRERTSAGSREEERIGRSVAEVLGIIAQSVHQGQRGWNQPIFAELCLSNRDDALLEVDVSHAEFQDFSHTKPASIKKSENFRHHQVPPRRTRRGLQCIECTKELSKLFVGQHSGDKSPRFPNRQCGLGHIRGIAGSQQELGEVANESDPLLLSSRTFVRLFGEPLADKRSRQLPSGQAFLHQKIVEAVQESRRFPIGIATGSLFLNQLIHERSEYALEIPIAGLIRHDSRPPDPTPRRARIPRRPSHRSVSIPTRCAPRSRQWLGTAFPSAAAESRVCDAANACPVFGPFETGFPPAGASTRRRGAGCCLPKKDQRADSLLEIPPDAPWQDAPISSSRSAHRPLRRSEAGSMARPFSIA